MNSIKGSNIRDMAAVLGVSEGAVAHAALESMGVDVGTDAGPSVDTALSLDPELSARDKKLVRALLGAMSAAEERDGSGSAAPMTQPAGDLGANRHQDDEEALAAASATGGEDDPGADSVEEPDFYALTAHRTTTPGMAQRIPIDEAGEESQMPPEGEKSGA